MVQLPCPGGDKLAVWDALPAEGDPRGIEQELPVLAGGIYEGLATVSGTCQGEQVESKTYVEQVGNWR